MASKAKRATALILGAMMMATAFTACSGNGSTSTSSTPSATPSTGGDNSTTSQASMEAVDILGDEYTAKLKDKMAEEATKADDGKTIELVVWCSGDDGKFEKSIVEEFKAKYADSRYELKITVKPVVGEDKAATKLMEDASAKGTADVLSIADDQINDLYTAGKISQVAQLFQASVMADNTAESVAACARDGVALGFPKSSDNGFFLFYDKRVYPNAEDIATFDSLIEKAKAQKKNVYMDIGGAWYNSAFFLTAGCTIKLEDNVQSADFNTPNGVSAVKAMQHIVANLDNGFQSGSEAGNNADIEAGFNDGSLAAAVTGSWMGHTISKAIGEENLGAAKLPTVLMDGEQKQLHSFGGYKVVVVNSVTKFNISAQTLAYYMTCPQTQAKRHSGYKDADGNDLSRGSIPTATSILETDAVKKDPAAQAIEAQRPFSHPQSNCGGKYWTPVGSIGGDLTSDQRNGVVADDATIMDRLNKVVEAFQ
ncbi:MAG: hypothetical protein ACI4M3_01370 [Acutalibacteraceae bacterium]